MYIAIFDKIIMPVFPEFMAYMTCVNWPMFGGYILTAPFWQSLEDSMLHLLPFHHQVVCYIEARALYNSVRCSTSICEGAQRQSHYTFCGSVVLLSLPQSSQTDTYTMEGGNGYLNTGSTGLVIGFSDNPTCHAHLGSMLL